MANEKSQNTIDGVPEIAVIHELMKSYEFVNVKVQRRNDRGHLAVVFGSHKIQTEKLIDFDSWLKDEAGGGDYFTVVRPPGDLGNILLKFNCKVEGPPLSPKLRTGQPVGVGVAGPTGGPVAPVYSRWAEGIMDEQARAQYLQSGHPQPAPGATMASDQLAFAELTEYKAKMARLEAAFEREREENARLKLEGEREREKLRLDMQEAKHESEMRLLRERMEAHAQQTQAMMAALKDNKPEPKQVDLGAIAAIIGAAAPVVAAYVTTSKESATKAMEIQQAGMATLMQATLDQTKKADPTVEMLKTLGPMLMPLLSSMMEQKSPAAQTALLNTMAENQLNNVAMMAQLIESFAGGDKEEPWWLPMVRETLGGVVRAGEVMLEQQQQTQQGNAFAQQQAAAQFQIPSSNQPVVSSAGYAQSAQAPQSPPTPVQAQPQAPTPARPQKATRLDPGGILSLLPDEYRTREWSTLITLIHEAESTPEDVGGLIADHIVHCARFDILPEQLANVNENPVEALEGILKVLPIYRQDRERANAILAATIDTLRELGAFDKDEEEVIETEGAEVDAA